MKKQSRNTNKRKTQQRMKIQKPHKHNNKPKKKKKTQKTHKATNKRKKLNRQTRTSTNIIHNSKKIEKMNDNTIKQQAM